MAYESPPELGGGAVYRNQRRCSSIEVTASEARGSDHNERAPQMSGSMEVTKAMARMLLDKFKAVDTEPSQRERTKGEQVVMFDVGANVASSTNIRQDGNPTGGYFYFWLRPKWVPKAKAPEPDLNDEIPF